ncbi:MAG: LysR substrate-binding domain-containing protein [Pseudomonadota bacterium]
MRALPSLKSLRCFEAAARRLSFTKAGAELGVSQSAVSHQIKLLEAELGLPLFRRLTRRLELTRAGHELLDAVAPAFEAIAQRVETLRQNAPGDAIALSLTFPIGAKWLAKCLREFLQAHPGIDVRLHYSQELVDFAREPCDLAIRWGPGGWPGLTAERLLPAALVPVAQAGAGALEPSRTPLLHEDSHEDWARWFDAAGLDPAAARRGTVVGDPLTLMEAAADGAILCRVALAVEELAAGRLVPLSDLAIDRERAYWLVYPKRALERPIVRALRDHLLAAAAADRARLDKALAALAPL